MPTVPDYTGAPRDPSDTRLPYLKDSATPAAFGVGVAESEQGFGRAVGQAADTASKWANTLQDQYNEAATTDGHNQFIQQTAQRTAEFNQLTGKAALAAQPDYLQFLEDKKKEVLGSVPNSAVARQLNQQLSRTTTGMLQSAWAHSAAQTKIYNRNEADASISLLTDKAGQAETDAAFGATLGAQKAEVERRYANEGYSAHDNTVKEAVKEKQTDAYAARWGTMVQSGQADKAMAEYTLTREKINDPTGKIHDSIYSGQVSQGAANTSRLLSIGALPSLKDKENYAMTVLTDKVGKIGAAGLVGGLHQESGLNPNAVNEGDGSDGSNSIGIGQWNAQRANALKAFAKDKDTDWKDYKTQVDFIAKELDDMPGLAAQLRNAKTPQEAADIANRRYEVSGDSPTGDERQQRGYANRVAHAQRLAAADIAPPKSGIGPDMSPARLGDLVATARAVAAEKFPDDPKAQEAYENSVRTRYNQVRNELNTQIYETKNNLRDMMYVDPNDKAPGLDELKADPHFKQNYDTLGSFPGGKKMQSDIDKAVLRQQMNPPATPEREDRYKELSAISTSDPQRFRQMNLWEENLTRQQQHDLVQEQKKLNEGSRADPQYQKATTYLDKSGFFRQAGIGPISTDKAPNPDYDKFNGQLKAEIKAEQSRTGKFPSNEDIGRMAAMLVTPRPSGLMGKTNFFQEEVPENERKKIIEQYSAKNNATPNDKTIKMIYNDAIYRASKNNPKAWNAQQWNKETPAEAPLSEGRSAATGNLDAWEQDDWNSTWQKAIPPGGDPNSMPKDWETIRKGGTLWGRPKKEKPREQQDLTS